jgi:hypothetical protein
MAHTDENKKKDEVAPTPELDDDIQVDDGSADKIVGGFMEREF